MSRNDYIFLGRGLVGGVIGGTLAVLLVGALFAQGIDVGIWGGALIGGAGSMSGFTVAVW